MPVPTAYGRDAKTASRRTVGVEVAVERKATGRMVADCKLLAVKPVCGGWIADARPGGKFPRAEDRL